MPKATDRPTKNRVSGTIRIVPAGAAKAAEAEFLVIHEGLVCVDGGVDALLASSVPYLRSFVA